MTLKIKVKDWLSQQFCANYFTIQALCPHYGASPFSQPHINTTQKSNFCANLLSNGLSLPVLLTSMEVSEIWQLFSDPKSKKSSKLPIPKAFYNSMNKALLTSIKIVC